MITEPMLTTALRYHHAGLTVLPNDPAKKYPADVKGWETMQVTEPKIRTWFTNTNRAIGLRDVEGLDFDNKGKPDAETLYSEWYALCDALSPGLPKRLLLEQTPSGGYHTAWRCEVIAGNQKLATRPPTDAERASNPRGTFVTLIETRGKGGQFQVAPSPGYKLIRGDWADLPSITPAERLIALDCARALSQADSRVMQSIKASGDRPGDAYNAEHADDARQLLLQAGWSTMYQRGDVLYLCRPGKDRGVSATLGHVAPNVLYVFSSSASPFNAGHAYTPFAIYAELEHGGNYKAAAATLRGVNTKTGEIQAPAKRDYVVPAERPSIINALELRSKEFPNLVWTVDGLIPEGLCMLAGKPKSKKSWLALGIAVGVASGGKAFNYYDVTQGRVLYLDLESNQRRMKSRLQGIISDREAWPANFDIATDWKRGSEGIALLDGYCEAHKDTRLIVIDIWARFRPSRDPKADAYEQDYNALQELNAWAESRNVTVIVIHHTRKAKSEDVFEEISGTTGIVGAVATALILTRSPDMPDEQLLHMTGRDLIIDEPIALKWDNYTCQHLFVATGAEASSSAERRKILAVMEDDQEYHLKDLAAAVGKSMKALDNHLRRLMDDRLIQRTGRGRYAKIPQQSTELQNDVENVELVDNVEYMDKVDSLVTKHSTSDQGRGIARGIGLAQQNAANPQFHEFHGDSIPTPKTSDLIERLKNRGARVLSDAEVSDILTRDNSDTTFSHFTGTPVDQEDDHATEG